MNIVMVGYAIIIQQGPKFKICKVTKFWSNGIDLLIQPLDFIEELMDWNFANLSIYNNN